jgi:hypothetical protein
MQYFGLHFTFSPVSRQKLSSRAKPRQAAIIVSPTYGGGDRSWMV